MNEYDSDRMGDCLVPFGYGRVDAPDQADVIILNTCHIRERAAHKVFSELGRLRVLKLARERDGARTLIVVAGCVAQAEGREIIARAPFVDVVVGPQTYHRLPALLARAWDRPGPLIDTDLPSGEKFDALPPPPPARDRGAVTAFLTVQEGCDKFCSFCVVPYTRGAEVSRPAAQVIAEARRMAASGVREITLLGQNVNAWHGQGADGGTWSLARLIGTLAEIPGLLRLRYTTSHPLDMDDDLIACHAREPKLMPFLHLPVQSGSDRILAAMNRRYTVDTYVRLVERLRRARPDIALSSDFIVGYPGETDADFAATMRLVERVTFAQAFTFKYSDRPGTPSAQAEAAVAEAVKDTRLQALQALIRAQQTAFNQDCLGATIPVLFTGPGRQPGQMVGRSPYLQPVHGIAPSHLIGCEVPMRITEAHTGSLSATPVMETART